MESGSVPQPPRLTWVGAALLTGACAALAAVGADARWLAALGGAIVDGGGIPDGVPFASAPSAAWHNVPVLGELVFHALVAGLGDRGLVLAQTLAVAAAFACLSVDLRRSRASDLTSGCVLLLVALAAAPALLVIRSQLFSLALFPALCLLLRAEARTPSRRVWLVVPLAALWTNLHGGVLVGVLVTGAYLLVDRLRRDPATALGAGAGMVAALLATPAGLGTAAYYWRVLRSEAATRGEGLWAPLSLHQPFDVAFLLFGLPLVLVVLRRRPPLWETVATAGLCLMALQASRNTVWAVVFAAVPAARALTRSRTGRPALGARPAAALAVVPLLLLVAGLARVPRANGAGAALLDRARVEADGSPVLADGLDAERLAVSGATIVIGNPLDAFSRSEQRAYLDWLAGRPAGDRLLHGVRVVVVRDATAAQRRLARNGSFARAAADGWAALYVRTASVSGGDRRRDVASE